MGSSSSVLPQESILNIDILAYYRIIQLEALATNLSLDPFGLIQQPVHKQASDCEHLSPREKRPKSIDRTVMFSIA